MASLLRFVDPFSVGYEMPKRIQFEVRLTNRPGVLGEVAEVASALWTKGITIQAFRIDIDEGEATIHLVVNKPAAARKVFAEYGWKASEK